jgi:hypothetical protein
MGRRLIVIGACSGARSPVTTDGRAGVILMMEQDDRADVDDGRTAEVGKAR